MLTNDDSIPGCPFDIVQNSVNPMGSIRYNHTFFRLRTNDRRCLLPDSIEEGKPIFLHKSVGVTFDLNSEFLFRDRYRTGD
jgi:hypothetical protein